MRHLLIIGRDLNQLVDLSIALSAHSRATTIAVTDDVAARALWSASKGPCQIIVCLNEDDVAIEAGSLVGISPPVLFLTSQSHSDLAAHLRDAGCLVLSAGEKSSLIAATLIAYGAPPVRAQRA
jgi:hypothetical protein